MNQDDRAHARYDIGVCAVLEAEAVGEAGHRQFRLRASAENGSALLWLEKEELRELAMAVKRMLRTSVNTSGTPQANGDADSRADFEFKVQRLALGYDRGSGRYMLLAQISEEEGDAIALWADRETLDRLADQAFDVHDAGRIRCPLCGGPMAEGKRHVCPRAN